MNTNKGSVNIFVHGVLQNRFFFEKTIQMLKEASKEKDVIDIGVVTFRERIRGTVSNETSNPSFSVRREFANELLIAVTNHEYKKLEEPIFIPSKEFLELTESMTNQTIKSKIKLLTEKGYNLGLRYEGSEINDSTLNMKNEIRKLVRTILPSDTKYNMIGHSRGGLACLSYAMTYPDDVNKVITLGTPYAGNIFAKYIGDNALVKALLKSERMAVKELAGETPFLKNLHDEWSKEGHKKVDLTAVGYDFGFGADGIVDIRSQLACYKDGDDEYKYVKRVIVRSNLLECIHSQESTNPRTINLLNNLIRQPKTITMEKDEVDNKYKTFLGRIADIGRTSVSDISKRLLRPKSISDGITIMSR